MGRVTPHSSQQGAAQLSLEAPGAAFRSISGVVNVYLCRVRLGLVAPVSTDLIDPRLRKMARRAAASVRVVWRREGKAQFWREGGGV
jgi:hypothetical protein